jgi:nucleoid-associated protein YgaU
MVALIQALNPGLQASTLSIGRTIKLPSATLQSPVKNKTPTERGETSGGRIYQVQEGDTLGGIAETELGSGKLWKDIYQLNKDIITDPARIRPGMRLVLPTLVDGQVQDLGEPGQDPGQDQEP